MIPFHLFQDKRLAGLLARLDNIRSAGRSLIPEDKMKRIPAQVSPEAKEVLLEIEHACNMLDIPITADTINLIAVTGESILWDHELGGLRPAA